MNRTIEVKGIKAKTRQRRLVHIPDNLLEWLTPFRKREGPITPERNIDVFSERLRGLAHSAGILRAAGPARASTGEETAALLRREGWQVMRSGHIVLCNIELWWSLCFATPVKKWIRSSPFGAKSQIALEKSFSA
ncbi:MAG: hypothetical protein ABSD57_14705 [Verrucomicrobiota bacterium]